MGKLLLYLKKFDWLLFAAVILLICFGLAEIYSIALSQSDVEQTAFKKQVIFAALGLVALIVFALIDYHNLRSYSTYIYIFGIILLLAVLFTGAEIRGTKGWFNIAGMSLQPVEFIKIALLIFLSKYFSSFSIENNPLKHLFLSGAGAGLLILLVLKQPDFGSALMLFSLWGAMVVMAGFNKKYILVIGLILLMIFGLGWGFFFETYQKQRIMTFLNPQENSLKEGYNITQAIIAVGSGGLTGRGIGFGSQSQLKFLPEAQNDFIFAVIAEELGFLGVMLVLGFFGLFFYRLFANLKNISDDFGIYFLLGMGALIFVEMFINIGMNIGIMPVVGIALPFISSGGSSILSTLIMVGIAESIIIRSKLKY